MPKYGMAIDLDRCMGCRACMEACKIENNTPQGIFWMHVFRFEEGEYPDVQDRFVPRPCMHCDNPPCVKACPTGALASEHIGDGVTLTYEASSCTGCEICGDVCPETGAQVLQVRRMTNLDTLSCGRMVLHKHQLAICEGCGASIAAQALLRRIEASLEGGDEALRTALSRYCPSCRLSFAWGARPSSIQRGM